MEKSSRKAGSLRKSAGQSVVGALGKPPIPESPSVYSPRGSVPTPGVLAFPQVTLGLPSQRRSAIPCAQCLSHACSLSHPCPFPPTFDMKGFSARLTLWGVRVIQIVAVGGTWSQMGGAASLPPLLPGPEAG